jgi:uncharacterized protein (DUF924 family)
MAARTTPGSAPGDFLPEPAEILNFWFGADTWGDEVKMSAWPRPDRAGLWWGMTAAMDAPLASDVQATCDASCAVYSSLIRVCGRGGLAGVSGKWGSSDGLYAQMLCCDQLARNAFRGTAEAFAYGSTALSCVRRLVSARVHESYVLGPAWQFLLTPGQHSESLHDHELNGRIIGWAQQRWGASAPLVAQLAREQREHMDVVRRFGRYPHRNGALGRASTAEELAWLGDRERLPGWAAAAPPPAMSPPAAEPPLGEADRRALGCFHRDGFAVLEQGILEGGGLSHDEWIRACDRVQRQAMRSWWGPGGDGGGGDGKVRRAVHLDQGGRRTPVAGTRAFAATFLEVMRRVRGRAAAPPPICRAGWVFPVRCAFACPEIEAHHHLALSSSALAAGRRRRRWRCWRARACSRSRAERSGARRW